MKKTGFLLILLLALALSACVPMGKSGNVDLEGTLIALNVQQTIQSQQIETLISIVNQPTAGCPTCTPVPATATQRLPSETPIPQPTATLGPTERPTGMLSGKLGYPSEMIPPLRIVAFNTVTGEYYWQNTVTNQSNFRFDDLPAATYKVLAYLIDNPSKVFYAGYSNFVTCGMDAACLDHNLIEVEVKAGQETSNVNPIDWYATDPMSLGWPLDPTIKWD